MKRLLPVFLALFLSLTLMATFDAEARRFGGGKSFGYQRSTPQRQITPTTPGQQASPAPTPTPPMQAPQPQRRSWLGPLAGLAAGVGLAALLSHFGMGEGVANFLLIALLVMAAFMLVNWLLRRSQVAQQPAQYAGDALGSGALPVEAQPINTATSTASSTSLPPGFDAEAFIRQAKINFIRLQAANDAGNLDDIREFTTPEIYAEIKMQLEERGSATSHTEVTLLNAEVLEAVEENNRQLVSVRFHGLLREDSDQATPFDEIWFLTRPIDASHGWLIAGIQQTG